MRYRQSYQPGPPSGDFVYVIQGLDAVKIGVARDPLERMATLQTGSPHPLSLAYYMPISGDAYAVESEAHAMLDRHRLAGEWFSVPAHVAVAAISGAAHRLGTVSGESESQEGRSPRWWLRYAVSTALACPIIAILLTDWPALASVYIFVLGVFIIYSVQQASNAHNIGWRRALAWLSIGILALFTAFLLGAYTLYLFPQFGK